MPAAIRQVKAADRVTAQSVLSDYDLVGKTAIVTGATSGVGRAIAEALVGAGADVTLAVRDVDAGQRVMAELLAVYPRGRLRVEFIDLLDLRSVKAFAERWGQQALDLLFNNAGLMAPPLSYTPQGFESQLTVNCLAPLLLSRLLLANLQRAVSPRIVTVSSGSHHLARLRLDDLHYRSRSYDKFEAYGHAKLCANLMAVAFSQQHAPITMNLVTPGAVASNLARHTTLDDAIKLGWVKEDGSLAVGAMRSPEVGAASPIWAAVAPELAGQGGVYVEDLALAPIVESPRDDCRGVTAESLDPQLASALWRQLLSDLNAVDGDVDHYSSGVSA